MKAKDFLGIFFILGIFGAALLLGPEQGSLTGMLIIDQTVNDCGDDLDCLADALNDCAKTVIYEPDAGVDLITVEPYNATACLMHYDMEDTLLAGVNDTSFDCRVSKGNYSMEELDEELDDSMFIICNGTFIDHMRTLEGYRPLEMTMTSPANGITIINRANLAINISLRGNLTLPQVSYALHARRQDGQWKKISITAVDTGGTKWVKGGWNTSALNISNVTALIPSSFRLQANFSNTTHTKTFTQERSFTIQATKEPQPEPLPGVDLYEPDGTFDTPGDEAKLIAVNGVTQDRSFHRIGDVDYLYFQGEANRIYTIRTHGLSRGVDTILQVYGNDKLLIDSDDDSGDTPNASLVRISLQSGERIFMRVSNAGSPGYYNITVTRLIDNDGDGYTIGLDALSDCDDNDAKKRPLEGGKTITEDLTLCPLACGTSCSHYDIEQPIIVKGNGIEIDCQFIPIKGTQSAPLFIINGSQDVTIANCIAENFSSAIVSEGCTGCRVVNSTFSGNLVGIRVEGGTFSISGSRLAYNNFSGIVADSVAMLTVSDSEIEQNSLDGAVVEASSGINITGNSISSNKRHGLIIIDSDRISIRSNSIRQNNNSGISMNGTDVVSIVRNNLENNRDGIAIFGSSSNLIEENNITGNKWSGISIQESFAQGTIRHNDLHSNTGTDIKNIQEGAVNATYNYWSTHSEEDIRGRIIDHYENEGYGIVHFSPWLISMSNYSEVLWAKNYTQCDDNLDNDGDGFIDYDGRGNASRKDPQCPDAFWNDESAGPTLPQPNTTNTTGQSNVTNATRPVDECVEDWECAAWRACEGGKKTRSCMDRNNCGSTEDRPDMETPCDAQEIQLCSNKKKDPLEEGIDCGGPCPPCKTPGTEMPDNPGGEEGGFPFITVAVAALIIAALGGGGYWYYANRYAGHGKKAAASPSGSPKAEEYVRDCLLKGLAPPAIREKMIESGWKHEDIEAALTKNDHLKGLHDFVALAMAKGFREDMITQSLESSGWDPATARMAVKAASGQKRLEEYLKNQKVKQKVLNMTWGNRYQKMHSTMRDKFGRPMYEMVKSGFEPKLNQRQPARQYPQQVQAAPPQPQQKPEEKKQYRLVERDGKFVIEAS